MADVLTSDQRRKCMSRVRSINTKPEILLRNTLWHLGFRYRVNDKRLPGKPDIVLPKYRTIIFVHGCFWHGHKDCKNYTVPKTNTDFWTAKIARNQERDQESWRLLEAKGWAVIIVWECELKRNCFPETIESVATQIHRNGEILRSAQEDRQKSRVLYREERRKVKDQEASLSKELHRKFGR